MSGNTKRFNPSWLAWVLAILVVVLAALASLAFVQMRTHQARVVELKQELKEARNASAEATEKMGEEISSLESAHKKDNKQLLAENKELLKANKKLMTSVKSLEKTVSSLERSLNEALGK